jgi:hypothetical protein
MVNERFRNPCRPAKFAGSKLPETGGESASPVIQNDINALF